MHMKATISLMIIAVILVLSPKNGLSAEDPCLQKRIYWEGEAPQTLLEHLSSLPAVHLATAKNLVRCTSTEHPELTACLASAYFDDGNRAIELGIYGKTPDQPHVSIVTGGEIGYVRDLPTSIYAYNENGSCGESSKLGRRGPRICSGFKEEIIYDKVLETLRYRVSRGKNFDPLALILTWEVTGEVELQCERVR